MTAGQERAITLALNILHVGFFECPRHDYQYFVNNDEWALMMAAAGPQRRGHAAAAARARRPGRRRSRARGSSPGMTDFEPPAHYCSFLRDKVARGERAIELQPCKPGEQGCPYATFEHIKDSK